MATVEAGRLLRDYHGRGDRGARDRLVELYLPLVRSLARRHSHGDDFDDLFQVGCIGLMKAIDGFRPERGAELGAYATPTIAGEMKRYLRDRGASVRVPRPLFELSRSAPRAQEALASRLGRPPTVAELAGEIGCAEDELVLALAAGQDSPEVPEAGAGDARLEEAEDRVFLAQGFRSLDDRERRALYLRYVRDLDSREVASALGVSERQLSRTVASAAAKVRAEIERRPAPGTPPAKPLRAPRPKPRIERVSAIPTLDPQEYIERPYHVELVRSDERDGEWTARVEELAGCEAHGATAQEAARGVESAIAAWVRKALDAGREVPEPRTVDAHSGKLMLRMPRSLHGQLARAAEREDVSLNQFITSALAAVVGWGDAAPPGGAAPPRPGLPRAAIVANVVVLAVTAAIAVAVLVAALVS